MRVTFGGIATLFRYSDSGASLSVLARAAESGGITLLIALRFSRPRTTGEPTGVCHFVAALRSGGLVLFRDSDSVASVSVLARAADRDGIELRIALRFSRPRTA